MINPSVEQTNSVVRDHDPIPSVPEQSATNSACGDGGPTYPGTYRLLNGVPMADAYSSTLVLHLCGSSK
jgi:hypothetical protein